MAKSVKTKVSDVDTVDAHDPAVSVMESGDEVGQGCLAGPGCTDECHRLSSRNHDINISKNRGSIRVGEGHVAHLDGAGSVGQVLWVPRIDDVGFSL
ncbi:hypothetical protein BMS3Bbin02_01227 [bacterium BMS3Bbin02]|nr:hypothetical protein BMS3Bbin02_01227 [bacterium BMS3Bbin02]